MPDNFGLGDGIKVTASIDDQITPGLVKIGANVKTFTTESSGHLKKFAFDADDFSSKLARSFSAVDVAAGAVTAAIVGLGAKTEQVYNKALKAFVASNEDARKALEQFDNAITRNDEAIGRAAYRLELLRRRIEEFASEGTAKGVAAINAVATAAGLIAKYGLGGNDPRSNGSGYNARSGAGGDYLPPKYNGPFVYPGMEGYYSNVRAEEQAYQDAADARARMTSPPPTYMNNYGSPFWNAFERGATHRGGPGMSMEPYPVNDPGLDWDGSKHAMDRLQESMQKAQRYTETLGNSLQQTFSGMLFDGMKLSEGLKGIFRSMVDSILAELSKEAAAAIVKTVIKLAVAGGGGMNGGVGTQVAPASYQSGLQELRYNQARGR